MYNAIDYPWMSEKWKNYFENNFVLLSGMYGILRPQDMIGNYKLPIEAKGLCKFWWEQITRKLNDMKADYIVDLLPNSYKKMIQWEELDPKVLQIDFFTNKTGELKKMTHGVKKVKGEYIKSICEAGIDMIEDFSWDVTENSEKKIILQVVSY